MCRGLAEAIVSLILHLILCNKIMCGVFITAEAIAVVSEGLEGYFS